MGFNNAAEAESSSPETVSFPNAVEDPTEREDLMQQAPIVPPFGRPPGLYATNECKEEEQVTGRNSSNSGGEQATARKSNGSGGPQLQFEVAAEATEEAMEKRASTRKQGMFAFSNVEEMKRKVRENKLAQIKQPYNVHDFYHETGFFQWLAKNERFDNLTLSIIVINAFWMTFDTDGNTADTIIRAKPVYVAADIAFFSYFLVEVLVRFCAFKKKRNCLKDGWFKFDATLVTLYAFDPFALGLMAALSGGGGLGLPTAILRLFRLARLSRLVRMLRSLPELMIMIKGMRTASSSVSYTMALLMIITYVFSIALRNIVPVDSKIEDLYFRSVPETIHNLILFGTFMDSLSTFIYDVKEESSLCLIFCWMYIGLAALTVMNMLIGVLCEVISSVAAEEKESMMIDKVNETFRSIVDELDENNDGQLSWEEFQAIVDHPQASSALEAVDVDPETVIDMAEDYFFEDGVPVELEFGEFVSMILDLRGGQMSTVKDVLSLGKRMTGKFQGMTLKMDGLERKIDGLQTELAGRDSLGNSGVSFQGMTERMDGMERKIDGLQTELAGVSSTLSDIASYIKDRPL
jgi:hypothetical protein